MPRLFLAVLAQSLLAAAILLNTPATLAQSLQSAQPTQPAPPPPGLSPLQQDLLRNQQIRQAEQLKRQAKLQQIKEHLAAEQQERDAALARAAALRQATQQIRQAEQLKRDAALEQMAQPAAPPSPPAIIPQPPSPQHHSGHKLSLPGVSSDSETDFEDDDRTDAPTTSNPSANPAADPRHLQVAPLGDHLDLTPAWLFERGENPQNASPTLNDSSWTLVDTRQPLWDAGQLNLNEIWYRAHLSLPPSAITPTSPALALTLTRIGGSYRVFVNGQEIGGRGTMSGRGDFLVAGSSTFLIPQTILTSSGGQLTIALHLFVGSVDRLTFTTQDGISSHSSVYLGPASLLARDEATYLESHRVESTALLTLWAVLLLIAVALAIMVPKVPAYRLLAIIAGAHLFGNLLLDYRNMHAFSDASIPIWLITPFTAAAAIAGLEFCRIAGAFPRRRWVTWLEAFYILAVFSLYPAAAGAFSLALYAILVYAAYIFIAAVDLAYIFFGARRRHQDAQILLATTSVYAVYLAWWAIFRFVRPNLGLPAAITHDFVVRFDPEAVANLFVALGLFLLLVTRTLRIVRERATIATEIDAARTMQQLLLGRSPKSTPGFAVETVYLPAGEVGGDFFLLSPTPDGALIAIVGDVSGKGLLAAMRVSMIFGILRREPSLDPANILAGLNEALLTQGEMGFTTACCLHIQPSGQYTFANAGHLAPYVMGAELPVAPALPLGLAPAQVYETLRGTLPPNQRMVLLSDGVPEARTEKGELYGFDRLGPLTLRPAAEIAQTAKAFGANDAQPDDITVLTIACLPQTLSSHSGASAPPPLPSAPPPPLVS